MVADSSDTGRMLKLFASETLSLAAAITTERLRQGEPFHGMIRAKSGGIIDFLLQTRASLVDYTCMDDLEL